MQVFDDFMPLHRVSCHHSRRPTPWFTDEISNLTSVKNKSKRKADKSKDPEDRVTFKKLKNELKVIRQAKFDYLQSLVSQARAVPSRAAEVWSHVNLMFGRRKHNHQTPHDAGSLNLINDHFQTVALGPSHKSAGDFVVPQSSAGKDSFGFAEISVDLVLTLLQTLDLKKSTGPDGLSARLVATEIATPLTHLYNASLSCGKFPSDWKLSHITCTSS